MGNAIKTDVKVLAPLVPIRFTSLMKVCLEICYHNSDHVVHTE